MAKSSKGGSFERQVSKELSLWWTEQERDDIFWRSSQSGGRATVRGRKGKSTAGSYGDITALDPIGEPLIANFCLELKRGYSQDTDILNMLDSSQKVPKLIQFWEQCELSRKNGKILESLVIFKRDRKHACVMMRTALYNDMQDFAGTIGDVDTAHLYFQGYDLTILRYTDLLAWWTRGTVLAYFNTRTEGAPYVI